MFSTEESWCIGIVHSDRHLLFFPSQPAATWPGMIIGGALMGTLASTRLRRVLCPRKGFTTAFSLFKPEELRMNHFFSPDLILDDLVITGPHLPEMARIKRIGDVLPSLFAR